MKYFKNFPRDEVHIKGIIKSIAKGLSHAHGLGIAHRDIKPDNIIMTSADREARPKLIDFGLSKVFH